MKFSYHKDIIGKPIKDSKGKLWVNDKQVNLGYGWQPADMEYDELFIMLSQGGYSLAPELKSDHRIIENFVSHSVALVDIDNGMKLDDLHDDLFYQAFGSGYYTTPSHTENDHRFRMIYRLETPITTAEDMRLIYEGLLAVYGAADISCKDPARLFYGTVEASHKEINNRILTTDGIIYLLEEREKVKPKQVIIPKDPSLVHPQTSLSDVQQLLNDFQRYYPILDYNLRFKVTRGIASSIGVSQTIYEMRTRWNDSEFNGKYELILKDPLKSDGPTIASIVFMIREFDPGYRKKVEKIIPNWNKRNNNKGVL